MLAPALRYLEGIPAQDWRATNETAWPRWRGRLLRQCTLPALHAAGILPMLGRFIAVAFRFGAVEASGTRRPACVLEACSAPGLLQRGRHEAWPSLGLAVLDGAFTAERCQDWCNVHGLRRRVVEKDPDQRGFVVLERRWVVERTFGWFSHWGCLHRERAGRLDVATGRLTCVARLMAARLMAADALNNPA